MSQLSRYIPPILLDSFLLAIRPLSGFSRRFSNFDEVLSRVRGYEDPNIVDSYEDRLREAIAKHDPESTTLIDDRKIRVLAALSLAIQRSTAQDLTLIDVGGGWGGDYFKLCHHFPELTKWRVIETVAVATRLGRVDRLPSKLSFESEWKESLRQREQSKYLIYASGFIQYVPEGLSTLADFAQTSRFLILDRVPLVDENRSYVAIQRTTRILGGVDSSYPCWFFSERQFREAVARHWRALLTWQVPEDRPVIKGVRRPYRGFLLERLYITVGALVMSTRCVLRSRRHFDDSDMTRSEMIINYATAIAGVPL